MVRKAIIPLAGFGTRIFPASKCVKKAFFPIRDKDGLLKPLLLILLEQLAEAGVEDVALVIGEGEEALYKDFFEGVSEELYSKLPEAQKREEDFIRNIGQRIEYIVQKEKKGFGHAVSLCQSFTNDEPVLLLLGDMIYSTTLPDNCMKQMILAYEKAYKPVVSIMEVPQEDVVHYGILSGEWTDDSQTLFECHQMKEKPSVEYAKKELCVYRNKEAQYYAVFGQYILTKDIFGFLEDNIKNNRLEKGEIQLTTALEDAINSVGLVGFRVDGKSYDVGLPNKYVETIASF